MVHKQTGRQGVRGELILEPARLIFRPALAGRRLDALGETILAIAEIRKTRRTRGSPVLKVETTTPGVPPVVLFYFAKPPDPYSSGAANPRLATLTFLTTSNAVLLDAIDEWVHAIREAART